jgi:hypothetical protein
VHLEPQPLGQPVDEPFLLVRPDLDRSVDVGRVKRVRKGGLPRKGRRRARPLDQRIAHEPTDEDPDEKRRGKTDRERKSAPVARIAQRRRNCSREEVIGNRLVQHQIEGIAQRRVLGAHFGDTRGQRRVARQCIVDTGGLRRGEPAVDIRMDVGFRNRRRHHFTTRNPGPGSATSWRKLLRARERRDITVPTGIDRMPAISS